MNGNYDPNSLTEKIEIECKNGYEEITVLQDNVGYGIARLDSGSKEATRLREQLYSLHDSKKDSIRIGATEYRLNVEICESFGEDVFRLAIKVN